MSQARRTVGAVLATGKFPEAREMFTIVKAAGVHPWVELWGVISEERAGEGDRLELIDRHPQDDLGA